MANCLKCGKELSVDEVGLHKKIVNRGATTYFCIDCLSEYMGISVPILRKKIEEFREMGCALFQTKNYDK